MEAFDKGTNWFVEWWKADYVLTISLDVVVARESAEAGSEESAVAGAPTDALIRGSISIPFPLGFTINSCTSFSIETIVTAETK